jgi:hypothetical protein
MASNLLSTKAASGFLDCLTTSSIQAAAMALASSPLEWFLARCTT